MAEYKLTVNGDYIYIFEKGVRDPIIIGKEEANQFLRGAPVEIEEIGVTPDDIFFVEHTRKGADFQLLKDWTEVGVNRTLIEQWGHGLKKPIYPIWKVSDFSEEELGELVEHFSLFLGHWETFNTIRDLEFIKAYLQSHKRLQCEAIEKIYEWYVLEYISKEVAFEFNYSKAEMVKEETYALKLSKEFDEHYPIQQESLEIGDIVIRTPKDFFEIYAECYGDYDALEVMEYMTDGAVEIYFVCDKGKTDMVWSIIAVEMGCVRAIYRPFESDKEAIDKWCLLKGFTQEIMDGWCPYQNRQTLDWWQ